MSRRTKAPGRPRILIPTRLAPEGIDILKAAGRFDVISRPGLKGAELKRELKHADAVIIRSEHKVTDTLMAAAPRLRLIARAGVGVENVDISAATERGIVVVNSPGANSIAVAELAMAMMLALSRRITAADRSVKSGEWNRSAFAGHELAGKTLGVVGFGRIGREVATRARAFGMAVLAYDPYIGKVAAQAADIRIVKLPELLRTADVISLHLPLTESTRGLIGTAELRKMKSTAIVINTSRGGIINEQAMQKALDKGQIAGCAIDVYESEPPSDRWFEGRDNVITTPHVGASTSESQTKVAIEIAAAVCDALVHGIYRNAVNLPVSDPSDLPILQPYMELLERMGRLLRALESAACDAITIELGSETSHEAKLMSAAALKGFLSPEFESPVTLVNAPQTAAERHLRVATVDRSSQTSLAKCMTIEGKFGKKVRRVHGDLQNGARIRGIDDFPLDLPPQGRVLIFTNRDRPGVIGAAGAVLGEAKINIASWVLGRKKRGGTALGVVTVDDPVPPAVIRKLETLPFMANVVQVNWESPS